MRVSVLAVALSLAGTVTPVHAQTLVLGPARPTLFAATRLPGLATQTPAPSTLAGEPSYTDTINWVAATEGVDARLVRAVIRVESGYQANARSPKGAMGLMQLMPDTASLYGVKNAYDPLANIRAGVRHLRMLLSRYPVDLALAAYNAGEAAVDRYAGIPPFPETQDYVKRVLEAAEGYGTNKLRPIRVVAAAPAGGKKSVPSASSSDTVPLAARLRPVAGAWKPGQPVHDRVPTLRRRGDTPAE